jgi:hypothetical protein
VAHVRQIAPEHAHVRLLTVLGGSGAGEEVQNQGNDRNQQNEMDQRSGYVKNKEAANPSNEEQQSNH